MVSVPIFDTITGLFTGKTKNLSAPSAANTRTPGTTYASQYPYNYSQITRAGNEVHLDDTPGNERIRFAHKSGSYYEVSSDGRKVEIVVANDSKTVKQSTTITIEKNGDIKLGGGARLVVGGDAHIEVKGDLTQAIGGNYNLSVGKNFNVTVNHGTDFNTNNKAVFQSQSEVEIKAVSGNVAVASLAQDVSLSGNRSVTARAVQKDFVVQVDNGEIIAAAKSNARLFSQEGQAGIYGLKGSAAICGNTYVAIRASGSDPQDPTGVNPPKGGELRISANAANFTTKSVNSWDVNGAGFVWKYSGGYSITNYSSGVPSTSQPPNPTDLRNK